MRVCARASDCLPVTACLFGGLPHSSRSSTEPPAHDRSGGGAVNSQLEERHRHACFQVDLINYMSIVPAATAPATRRGRKEARDEGAGSRPRIGNPQGLRWPPFTRAPSARSGGPSGATRPILLLQRCELLHIRRAFREELRQYGEGCSRGSQSARKISRLFLIGATAP